MLKDITLGQFFPGNTVAHKSTGRIKAKTIRGENMEYMTASQAAKLWHISQRRVQILCAEGRIPGVFKLGEAWAIPKEVEKPLDMRKKLENNNEKI